MSDKPITTIRITQDAIDYLARVASLEQDDAEELLTALFTMCMIPSSAGGGRVEELVAAAEDVLKFKNKLYGEFPIDDTELEIYLHNLEMAVKRIREGDRGECKNP